MYRNSVQKGVGRLANLSIDNGVIQNSFPAIWKYLENPDVTDLDFNCGNLWLSTVSHIPCLIKDEEIAEGVMKNFSSLVAQSVGCNFNPIDNTAYSNTENLRITCVHESQSRSGLSVNIRRFEHGLRRTREEAIADNFMTEEIMHFLDCVAKAEINMFFCGAPGHGKTETLKLIASHLPKHEKVITIEDVGEINYPVINPGANCDELKIINGNYKENIEKALRMNASRILFGEARGSEAEFLLECMSNGIPLMSTLHLKDARGLADRILNMMNDTRDSARITNQIYDSAGVCVLVKRVIDAGGTVRRKIDQVCLYSRDEFHDENKAVLVVKNGKLDVNKIPEEFRNTVEEGCGCSILYDKTAWKE